MDKYVGKRLDGRYEIQEVIGVGGMAVVYKAFDSIDGRVVAVKILKEEFLKNDEFRRRFKNESKAIAVLSHPNIVKVYDVSFGDLIQYIVMEYIEGTTLKQYIESRGIIPWPEAVLITRQILGALNHAHQKGIIHRDIKPQNIMMLPDKTVKVTDFGIARFSRDEQRTITDKAIGSVHYISPEQARGDATNAKADLYSVGVLLYEMLTGCLPFEADSAVSVAIMQLQSEPKKPREINPVLPVGLEQIIMHAMEKNVDRRYESAAAMLADLDKIQQDPDTTFDYTYFVDESPTRYVTARKPDGAAAASQKIDQLYEEEEEAEQGKKKPPMIAILAAIAAAFVVVGVIFFFVLFNNWNKDKGEDVECPDLIGMDYTEVMNNPEYEDLTIIVEAREHHPDYETNQIFEQTPTGGMMIKTTNEIRVKVSLGKRTVKIPKLEKEEESAATDQLRELGLEVTSKPQYHESIEKGFVIETDPPAGQEVAEGSSVTLYVSQGAEVRYSNVPDVTGLTLEKATAKLESAGLYVGSTSKQDSDSPEGTVISQDPVSGQVVAGTRVNLVLSSGQSSEKTVSVAIDLSRSGSERPSNVQVAVCEVGTSTIITGESQVSTAGSYTFKISSRDAKRTVDIRLDNMYYQTIEIDMSVSNGNPKVIKEANPKPFDPANIDWQ